MQIVYFTVIAIGLYFFSDWVVNRIETMRGERFANRSIIFFFVLLTSALVVFQAIERLAASQWN